MKPELSYVALLLLRGTTYHRVKYSFNSLTPKPPIEIAAGPDWTAGFCEQSKSMSFYKDGSGLPRGATLSVALPPADVVAHHDVYNVDGGFYLVLPVGVRLVDWVVHKGKCCAAQASSTDDYSTCQPDRLSAAYKVQFLQYVDDGARSGNQWLFPAGPNDDLCRKLGGKAYEQACVSSTVTGSPRR